MNKRRTSLTALILFVLGIAMAPSPGAASEAEDLRDLHNRALISEALAQYPYRWDTKDTQGFANLFTEDGIMERKVGGETVEGSVVQGKAAIFEYGREAHLGRLAEVQSRHHFSNVIFLELEANHAVTQNMALITHQVEGSAPAYISSSGIYLITWRNTEQGWKIANRALTVDRFTGP